MWLFQSRCPFPPIFIRCLLQSTIETENRVLGKLSEKEFVIDDMEELVLPASWLLDPGNDNVEAPHDPRFQVARKMAAFIPRAAGVYGLGLEIHSTCELI